MWRGWNEIAFLAGYFELASVLLEKNVSKIAESSVALVAIKNHAFEVNSGGSGHELHEI